MSPDQQTPNPTTETNTPAPGPTPPTGKGSSKAVVVGFVVAGVVVALLIAVVAFMLMNQDNKDNNQNTNDTGNNQNDSDDDTPPASNKVVATVESSTGGLLVDLYEPKKSGETLVVNYKLYNKDSDGNHWGYPPRVGIYATDFSKDVPEPYAVANSDGQKYGLVRDDQGEALATQRFNKFLKKGESISGFVTLTLPPNNSTVSISLGSMPVFNDIKISY